MRPVGRSLRRANPRAYERVRWSLAKTPLLGGLLGHPMYHNLVLPFVVRSNDTVFDIGANVGQYTLPLARLVGPNGRVHSFEPVAATIAELRSEVEAAGLGASVVLNQFALGDHAGTVELTLPLERPTEATLAPHEGLDWADYSGDSSKYVIETVSMVTLDEYLTREEIGSISFLKCDVEGAEFGVLKGARSLLSGPRPPVLQLEVFAEWTKNFDYTPNDLFDYLRGTGGYEIYWFCEQGLEHIEPGAEHIPGIFHEWVDFLCVVPDVHRSRLDVRRYLA
jgi:FkbM family methyltransferase